jgi:futalosine hydrolase
MNSPRILIAAPSRIEYEALCRIANATENVDLYVDVDVVQTGIGILSTACSVANLLTENQYQWAICAGVAGSFSADLNVGATTIVHSEQADDMSCGYIQGFEGAFNRMLVGKNEYPFEDATINCPHSQNISQAMRLPLVKSLTVSLLAATPQAALVRGNFYDADIENMEGVAFFYACRMRNIPFVEIRSISNAVGTPPTKQNIALALTNLQQHILSLLKIIQTK